MFRGVALITILFLSGCLNGYDIDNPEPNEGEIIFESTHYVNGIDYHEESGAIIALWPNLASDKFDIHIYDSLEDGSRFSFSIQEPVRGNSAYWSHDGKLIVVLDGNLVKTLNRDGLLISKVEANGRIDDFAISPVNNRIIVMGPSQVQVIDVEKSIVLGSAQKTWGSILNDAVFHSDDSITVVEGGFGTNCRLLVFSPSGQYHSSQEEMVDCGTRHFVGIDGDRIVNYFEQDQELTILDSFEGVVYSEKIDSVIEIIPFDGGKRFVVIAQRSLIEFDSEGTKLKEWAGKYSSPIPHGNSWVAYNQDCIGILNLESDKIWNVLDNSSLVSFTGPNDDGAKSITCGQIILASSGTEIVEIRRDQLVGV